MIIFLKDLDCKKYGQKKGQGQNLSRQNSYMNYPNILQESSKQNIIPGLNLPSSPVGSNNNFNPFQTQFALASELLNINSNSPRGNAYPGVSDFNNNNTSNPANSNLYQQYPCIPNNQQQDIFTQKNGSHQAQPQVKPLVLGEII